MCVDFYTAMERECTTKQPLCSEWKLHHHPANLSNGHTTITMEISTIAVDASLLLSKWKQNHTQMNSFSSSSNSPTLYTVHLSKSLPVCLYYNPWLVSCYPRSVNITTQKRKYTTCSFWQLLYKSAHKCITSIKAVTDFALLSVYENFLATRK